MTSLETRHLHHDDSAPITAQAQAAAEQRPAQPPVDFPAMLTAQLDRLAGQASIEPDPETRRHFYQAIALLAGAHDWESAFEAHGSMMFTADLDDDEAVRNAYGEASQITADWLLENNAGPDWYDWHTSQIQTFAF